MATYVISLESGIGNIVETLPFMWFLKGRGDVVIARQQAGAYSREACELACPAYDELIDAKWHIIGAIDKGFPNKGVPCKGHDRPEWEAWFSHHGFVIPKADEVKTETAWEDVAFQYDVVLAPTSKPDWPMKFWPHWSRLVEMMPGCAVVGLPGDGGELRGRYEDLRGKLTLRQTAGLFRKAKLVIAQDSGMCHLAAAQGTRTYILYGGTSWWKNFPPRNGVLVTPKKLRVCQPCQFKGCHIAWENGRQTWHGCRPEQKVDGKWSRCLYDLTPERVMEVVGWVES